MKKTKRIELSLKKQIIAKLDNDNLKEIKGGKDQQFLSIFHCCTDNSRSCGTVTNPSPTMTCPVIDIDLNP